MWKADNLTNALREVKSGMPGRKASRLFGIPKSKLGNYTTGGVKGRPFRADHVPSKMGRSTALNADFEQ